jgi:hypothetical protein
MRELRHTIFSDIDGVLWEHLIDLPHMMTERPSLLPGVQEKFCEWRAKDYYIILTTARPEGCRRVTEDQLASYGLFWDQLVMGLPVGPRVLINDIKPSGLQTAIAVNLVRNTGLVGIYV